MPFSNQICHINEKKWRASQYLALYSNLPYEGVNLARGLIELSDLDIELKYCDSSALDFPVDYAGLADLSDRRRKALQHTQLCNLTDSAVQLAGDALGGLGEGLFEHVALVLQPEDYAHVPKIGKGRFPSWGFRIAMLHAAHTGLSPARITEVGRKETVRLSGPWGRLFMAFKKATGLPNTRLASSIMHTWTETGVTL